MLCPCISTHTLEMYTLNSECAPIPNLAHHYPQSKSQTKHSVGVFCTPLSSNSHRCRSTYNKTVTTPHSTIPTQPP